MRRPKYIKVTSRPPKNPWPVVNKEKMEILKEIGGKFGELDNALYLIGSASGREGADRVNDLDLVVIVSDSSRLYEAEELARQHKKIEGIKMPVTCLLLPLSWLNSVEKHIADPLLGPAFLTYVKANNVWLGGKDLLKKIKWPVSGVIRMGAIFRVKRAVLSLFKEINKERFTKEQNYLVLKYIREIMFNAMYAKFYFGFSKTELFELFLREYRLKNIRPARLLYESRRRGRDHFVNQEPRALQDSVLLFAQEMWSKMDKLR